MSTFEAKVFKLTIEEHPNADALELAVVGDYRSIVLKGQYKTGDLGVYLPEAAVLPEWLIAELGLEGRLAGKAKNRIKAIKLRKILSQGIILPVWNDPISGDKYVSGELECDREFVTEGDVVTDFLGITKYEPPIPVHMQGEVFNAFGMTLKYDIENYKWFPDVLIEGERVIFTEKIHGTFTLFGYHPEVTHPIVSSKGLSAQGLAFKFNDANKDNLYINALNDLTLGKTEPKEDIITRIRRMGLFDELTPFYVLGETFGTGIQDLKYGEDKIGFRVFDIYVGAPGKGRYVDCDKLAAYCQALEVDMVPILYDGPYSKAVMDEYTSGKETVSGTEANLREGIVIKPALERHHIILGRVFLKSVSEAYLLRKGNTTELN